MVERTEPAFGLLLDVCAAHGISRSVAYELVASGHLETFKIGAKRYVLVESLRALPGKLAGQEGGGK